MRVCTGRWRWSNLQYPVLAVFLNRAADDGGVDDVRPSAQSWLGYQNRVKSNPRICRCLLMGTGTMSMLMLSDGISRPEDLIKPRVIA